MKSVMAIWVAGILLGVGSVQATPTSYSGRLSVAGGTGDGLLTASGAVWNASATSVSWVVDNTTTPGKWHYRYTLTVPGAAISHLIIEASDGEPGPAFTAANLFSPASSPDGWIDGPAEIKWHDAGSVANTNMPDDLYGIKFDADVSTTVLTLSFDSDRVPVWGDFYARSGRVGQEGFNTLFNAGFLAADPLTAPHDGSEQDHLLVPDSMTEPIPAPGAVFLGGVGVVLIGWMRHKRTF